MTLLLDSCVSRRIAPALRAQGHDAVCVGDWADEAGDEQILAFALKEGRTIVTLEKDSGELAVAFGRVHAGIIRLVNFPLSQHAAVCLGAIAQHGAELTEGAIETAAPGRLRLRPVPSTDPFEQD